MAVADDKFILTPAGYEHLKSELARLQGMSEERRELLADSLDNSLGQDDNPEIMVEFEWRTRKEWTDEQIGHLKFILDRAEIYDDPNPKAIDPGERVTLFDMTEKEEIQMDVVSSAEVTSRANVGPGVRDVSAASPLGLALLGKRVGDVVEVEVPDGIVRYTVRKIEPIPME
jgi:transcription elongation factor GreA